MFLNGYPYTDFHEMNLDFLLQSMNTLKQAFKDFTASNSLVFAEPLLHDVSKSYAKNTVVLDSDGNAYISIKAVPSGVQLDNSEYWLMVFNFEDYTEKANKNFTDNYFRDTERSDRELAVDDWVVLNDVLYKVTVAIPVDGLFEVGVNLVHFTVEQFLKDFTTSIVNTVNQYKNDIDASELAYQLAMQAEVDRILAGATVDSEVIDARLGFDGVNYTTLGQAIRTQCANLNKSNAQHIAVNDSDFIVYDSATKTITFPTGGFYFYGGRGHANASSHVIDLTNILNNNACAFWIADDYSITATSWGTRPNDDTSQLIGYMYNQNLVIFGVEARNIKWLDANGKVVPIFSHNDGSFIGNNGNVITWNRDTYQLTVASGFYSRQGIGGNVSSQTIDLSTIDTSGIYKLWLRPNATIYGTKWGASGVAEGPNDSCIGFIWDTTVYVKGVDMRAIAVTKNSKKVKPVSYPNSLVGISQGAKIVYDYINKTLTFPIGFEIYCGEGFARPSELTLDVSAALDPSSEACVIALKANKTIYAIDWDSNAFTGTTDTVLGYIFSKNVFLYGVDSSQIEIIDNSIKEVFCFGDSITAGVGSNYLYHMQFADWNYKLKCYNWGVGSTGYVTEATGDVVVGGGVIGDGSTQTESGDNSVLKVMQTVTDPMANIIIEAGTNDWGSNVAIADFRTAVQDVLDYALTKTYNIFVMTPFKRNGWATSTNTQGLKLEDYADVIIEECEARGICYYNGYDVQFNPTNAASRTNFVPDGLHPNTHGHKRIARAVWDRFLEAIEL